MEEKYIENTFDNLVKKLYLIEKNPAKGEIYEKTLIANHLNKDSCVLELGGGRGCVSNIIQKIIKDPKRHIIIEPEKSKANKLTKDGYNVFNGIIANKPLYFKNNYVTTSDNGKGFVKLNNITNIKNLETKYKIKFDTLIADCEGALPQVFNDNIQLYDQIKFIQIEYDWLIKDCTEFRNKLLEKNFVSLEQLPLHWSPSIGKGAFRDDGKIIGHEILIKK